LSVESVLKIGEARVPIDLYKVSTKYLEHDKFMDMVRRSLDSAFLQTPYLPGTTERNLAGLNIFI